MTHKHIWKYNTASNTRVCEAPFPTIESCGKVEEFKECKFCDFDNPVYTGLGHFRCKDCGRDLTLELVLLKEKELNI
jgi:hypothetical protein